MSQMVHEHSTHGPSKDRVNDALMFWSSRAFHLYQGLLRPLSTFTELCEKPSTLVLDLAKRKHPADCSKYKKIWPNVYFQHRMVLTFFQIRLLSSFRELWGNEETSKINFSGVKCISFLFTSWILISEKVSANFLDRVWVWLHKRNWFSKLLLIFLTIKSCQDLQVPCKISIFCCGEEVGRWIRRKFNTRKH